MFVTKNKKSILEPREAKVNGLDHCVARFLTPSLVRNKRHDLNEFRIFLCPTSCSPILIGLLIFVRVMIYRGVQAGRL
jgi:hypothetical protein